MSRKTIWNYLRTRTSLPETSIAGIMGNMECESNCEACRLQGDFSADRGVSRIYASAADCGSLSASSFARDGRGWGLCQWTYPSRKEALLASCASRGKSIADEEAQLAFMLAEMQAEYAAMWKRLLSAGTVADAAGLVCREYERPAVLNIAERTKAGEKLYEQFRGTEPEAAEPEEGDPVLREWMEFNEMEIARLQAKNEELRRRTK